MPTCVYIRTNIQKHHHICTYTHSPTHTHTHIQMYNWSLLNQPKYFKQKQYLY